MDSPAPAPALAATGLGPESAPAESPARAEPVGAVLPCGVPQNQESAARAESPPRRKRRIGRGAVLIFIRQRIGAGAGIPDAEAVAFRFGWRVSSARDALQGLVADGLLREAGREPPHGKVIYELTAAGAAAVSKRCTRCDLAKPSSSFWASRFTRDGLAEVCKTCIRAAAERARQEREARRKDKP